MSQKGSIMWWSEEKLHVYFRVIWWQVLLPALSQRRRRQHIAARRVEVQYVAETARRPVFLFLVMVLVVLMPILAVSSTLMLFPLPLMRFPHISIEGDTNFPHKYRPPRLSLPPEYFPALFHRSATARPSLPLSRLPRRNPGRCFFFFFFLFVRYSLNQLRAQMAPLQRAQREQSASSASLASEKESLRKEVENWKKRVSSLTASFNAVS